MDLFVSLNMLDRVSIYPSAIDVTEMSCLMDWVTGLVFAIAKFEACVVLFSLVERDCLFFVGLE
jgi:hypothetical protein